MFETLYTRHVITALFILGLMAIGYICLKQIQVYGASFTWPILFGGLLAGLALRLVCEWIIVQFRIYETLQDISRYHREMGMREEQRDRKAAEDKLRAREEKFQKEDREARFSAQDGL